MKQLQGFFKVLAVEYAGHSINGNPKKRLILEDGDGGTWVATTATDSLAGYYHPNKSEKYSIAYHFTKKNCSMVIDFYNDI